MRAVMLERQKRRLLAMKAEVEQQMRRLHAMIRQSVAEHSVLDQLDESQANQAIDTDLVAAEFNASILKQIDDALVAIARGLYGVCEGCHQPIEIRRLSAVPFARTCQGCQKRVEAA